MLSCRAPPVPEVQGYLAKRAYRLNSRTLVEQAGDAVTPSLVLWPRAVGCWLHLYPFLVFFRVLSRECCLDLDLNRTAARKNASPYRHGWKSLPVPVVFCNCRRSRTTVGQFSRPRYTGNIWRPRADGVSPCSQRALSCACIRTLHIILTRHVQCSTAAVVPMLFMRYLRHAFPPPDPVPSDIMDRRKCRTECTTLQHVSFVIANRYGESPFITPKLVRVFRSAYSVPSSASKRETGTGGEGWGKLMSCN